MSRCLFFVCKVKRVTEFEERHAKSSSAFLILIFVAGLVLGGVLASYLTLREINTLQDEVSNLNVQVSKLWGIRPQVINQSVTVYQNSTALSELYGKVKDSVVLILGTTWEGTVQGSGFVYNFSGIMIVITNYHVVHGPPTSISVTFSNGNGYPATVQGTDPYADLAVLSVDAPESEFRPLEVVNSLTLKVGDPVIAIGNPYGLVGSMTTGVVSALGRTITEEHTGGFSIANIIQTSAPINPGNSGGPLLNHCGNVVGITTAIVQESQGLGFAVPSSAIKREIESLWTSGKYEGHSYLGLMGINMNYEEAQTMGVNVTYGWKVVEVVSGGPSYDAGVKTDDILIGIRLQETNGTRIRNGDDMASYLEEYTSPGDTVVLTIRRGDQTLERLVVLERRPSA